MNTFKILMLTAGLIAALPAHAQDTAEPMPDSAMAAQDQQLDLRPGMLLVSAEGRRVGRIDSVVGDEAAPTAIKVIKGMKIVTVPANTLSPDEESGRVMTSLSYRDIR